MAAGDLKNAPYGCVNDKAAGVSYTAPSGNGETNTTPAPAAKPGGTGTGSS
jgi:hypothetical protein